MALHAHLQLSRKEHAEKRGLACKPMMLCQGKQSDTHAVYPLLYPQLCESGRADLACTGKRGRTGHIDASSTSQASQQHAQHHTPHLAPALLCFALLDHLTEVLPLAQPHFIITPVNTELPVKSLIQCLL